MDEWDQDDDDLLALMSESPGGAISSEMNREAGHSYRAQAVSDDWDGGERTTLDRKGNSQAPKVSAGRKHTDASRLRNLSVAPESVDFIRQRDTFAIEDGDWKEHGITSHRGVLDVEERELLQRDVLLDAIVDRLGHTPESIEEIYRVGRPDAARRAEMGALDARFLEIQEGGGNLTELARALGWHIDPDGKCQRMAKVLQRAREADSHQDPPHRW